MFYSVLIHLFSTPFWKIKVPNHQSIKEKYLQSFIDGYEKKIFDIPEDWVLATGESHSVQDFLDIAFNYLNLDPEKYVESSDRYFRPNEVDYLLGDSSKASKKLNWTPETDFESLVKMMVDSDLKLAKQEKTLINEGLLKPTWDNFS